MLNRALDFGDAPIETIGGWLEKAEAGLSAGEVEAPRLSARLILEKATSRPRAYFVAHPEATLTSDQRREANGLLRRRLLHEPMAYLLGVKDFGRRTIFVSPSVLIPRPETEGLIDLARRFQPEARRLLDAGSGSGCLALSLSDEFPRSIVIGCDASSEALEVARRNDPEDRIRWVRSRWLEPFAETSFDLIVSNPPYLTTAEMRTLDLQVKDYEPAQALHGGEDGCDDYRILIPQAKKTLRPGGVLLLEISPTVRSEVVQLLSRNQFGGIEVKKDLAGRERYAKGVKIESA